MKCKHLFDKTLRNNGVSTCSIRPCKHDFTFMNAEAINLSFVDTNISHFFNKVTFSNETFETSDAMAEHLLNALLKFMHN